MKTNPCFVRLVFFPFLVLFHPLLDAQTCPNISGLIQYENVAFSPLFEVQVQLCDLNGQVIQTASTNYEGRFYFCHHIPGNYILTFNCNVSEGGINATDALEVLRHYLGFTTLEGLRLRAADVNASGYVNASDALVIAKYYSGLIDNFVTGTWLIDPEPIAVADEVPTFVEIRGLCYGDADCSHNPVGNQVMNTPCPGIATFTYGGQVYNTVQIGSQCWMKENLNIGTMVNSVNTDQSHTECHNNGIIEKFCYNNNPAMCEVYGGLYDWNEMMQYATLPGAQGICPAGWHVPTDAEWCTLNLYLDATVNCNAAGQTGTTVGSKMKQTGTSHWFSPNDDATNESGYTALGAGYRDPDGYFMLNTYACCFWESYTYSSTQGVYRWLGFDGGYTGRQNNDVNSGFSVRCIKNN